MMGKLSRVVALSQNPDVWVQSWKAVKVAPAQFVFFDFGAGKLFLNQILAHLRVGVVCKFYRQPGKNVVTTRLCRSCGWKQSN